MKLRVIGVSFTFVGAVVGAGFASGREISLYFAHTSVFTPLLAGVLITAFFYLFLSLGRYTGGNIELIGGRVGKIMPILIKCCSYVTLVAMIAGSEEIIYNLFHIHGGSVVTGVLALIVVLFGVEKIKLSNVFIVPAIIIMIALVFFKEKDAVPFEKLSVIPAFTYATMNVISAGFFASKMSGDFDKKECLITALIGGIITTALILAVFFSIQNTLDFSMPLLSAATNANLSVVGYIVAYLAVFSTLTGSLSIVSGDKGYLAVILTSVGFLIALVGFRNIVDKCYPIMGAVGGIMTVIYIILYLKRLYLDKKTIKIPEARLG